MVSLSIARHNDVPVDLGFVTTRSKWSLQQGLLQLESAIYEAGRHVIFLPCVGCRADSEELPTLVLVSRFEFFPSTFDAASGGSSLARGG
jgi:hypothetical protein